MARALILYATVEGQTARIAERIALRLSGNGHTVDLQRVNANATAGNAEQRQATSSAKIRAMLLMVMVSIGGDVATESPDAIPSANG